MAAWLRVAGRFHTTRAPALASIAGRNLSSSWQPITVHRARALRSLTMKFHSRSITPLVMQTTSVLRTMKMLRSRLSAAWAT